MKWIAILTISIVLTGSALAAGSDDQYLGIYNEILQADSLMENGHLEAAASRYLQAQTELQKLQTEHPSWNPDIVQYRVDYLAEKLRALGKSVPATNAPPAAPSAPAQPAGVVQPAAAPPAPPGSAMAALEEQNAGLQEQVRSLTSANAELEGKLKEALSVQPAAVSPDALAKAEARIVALQKERDLLAVALDQEKASNARAYATEKTADFEETNSEVYRDIAARLQKTEQEVAQFQTAAAKSERQLAAANKELEWLKAQRVAEAAQAAALKVSTDADAQKSQDEIARLKEAAAESEQKLAAANKDLESLRTTRSPQVGIVEGGKQIPEERDQLKQLQSDISKDDAEIARLNDALTDAQKKLAAANSELASLKTPSPAQSQPADAAKAVIEERDKLKAELAERSKDLADVEAHHNEELLSAHMALQQAEQRRDELEKKLAAVSQEQPVKETPSSTVAATVPAAVPATNSAPSERPPSALELDQLQARVAVLEAAPVPYTADELALLKMPPPAKPVELPKPVVQSGHVHSSDDLPPGSGALWAEAMRASAAGDFDTAEKKYKEVLQQDETNVYVLAFLANAQFAAGQLTDCEKSLKQALAVDPEDPGSLYLLGLLRYRQERLDESFDALSLSARINPTNAATQNFLGCVLADKGLRPAAETALRKALRSDPDYADAHFNLAVVYAGNQPPSLELARWHYKRALALGHARSATLDKLLGENP